jgi:hypothetical protein
MEKLLETQVKRQINEVRTTEREVAKLKDQDKKIKEHMVRRNFDQGED